MSRHRYYASDRRGSVASGDLSEKPTNDRESELEEVKTRLQHELTVQADLKREIRDLTHKLEISSLDAKKREREVADANGIITKLRLAQSRLQHEVDDLVREKDSLERDKRQVQNKLERLLSENHSLEQDKQNLRLKVLASEGSFSARSRFRGSHIRRRRFSLEFCLPFPRNRCLMPRALRPLCLRHSESNRLALQEERELKWQLQELRAELGRKTNQLVEAETRSEMLQDKIKQIQSEKPSSTTRSVAFLGRPY
jgi:chromosome segregation ATPase